MLKSDEERTLLRKCIVFYSTLGNEDNPKILKRDIRRILDMPFRDIKTQLDSSDQEYISEFYKGNYRPDLLFSDEIAQRLLSHPVALNTQMNIKECLKGD